MANHPVGKYDALGLEKEPVPTQAVTRNRVAQLSSIWLVPLAAAAFWMILVWSIHWSSPRTLVSFHGLLHAAIGGQFLGPAPVSFPPENPFYAGEPVAYYWFFQFLAAQLTRVFGLNIFHSMGVLILVAAGVLTITAVSLGRRLYYSTLSGVLMGYLIMAGTNPLGWVHLIYKIVRRGPHILRDDPNHLWGVVHPIYSLIRYNDVGGLYGPLLNFFLNITSRPVALATLLVMVFCMEWLLRSGRTTAWAALAAATGATTALSPIIGISVGGALLLGLAVSWFWARATSGLMFSKTNFSRRALLSAALAIIAGTLIAAPTYYHLLVGPSASHPRFLLVSIDGLRHIIMVGLSISLLAVLALVGLFRAARAHRSFLGMLILAAFVLLGFDLVLTLPASNQSNWFHAAALLLSVPAAGSIFRVPPGGKSLVVRRRLTAGVCLVFLPTVLLLLTAYIRRPALPASFNSENIVRMPENSDLALLYRWVQNETDPKSVFIIDPRDLIAMCGNTTEFPAMTRRVIFTEDFRHYIAESYPDSRLRFDMAVRFVSGERPQDADSAYLSKFNRPVYIVSYHAEDKSLMDRMREIHGLPAFQVGSLCVYECATKPTSSDLPYKK